MLTKTQFANMIIDDYCTVNSIDREKITKHITGSSKLAVALEFLGMLDDDGKRYSSQRAGVLFSYINDKELHILSLRELLELLPD